MQLCSNGNPDCSVVSGDDEGEDVMILMVVMVMTIRAW